MRHKIIILLFFIFIFGCSIRNHDIKDLLVDKIWLSNLNDEQFYYSSNNKYYVWTKFVRRNGKTYTPFSLAQGTPAAHPLPKVYRDVEGWQQLGYFDVVGESLVCQNEEDVNALELDKFKIEIGNDTTIGMKSYKTIIVTNEYATRTLKSTITQ